jgi:predicted ATPase/DNA-binding CsgD family transcriptional regulator
MEQAAALSTYLPGEPNRFIGRERELSDLRLALRQTRQLTLCGAGGIGKTRLALQLLTAVRQEYPDGVFLVELGDLWEPDLIVSRMAALLGIDGEASRDLLDTLAGALGARQVLVLLDNCEHLVDACATLCQRLLTSCPGVRMVATSQEPLRIPQEAVWQVAPLAVPPPGHRPAAAELGGYEAVALFADRAAAARPGFAVTERNATAVATICRELDGVPLAIELAAARVTVLSAEQIAARLADRFTLLGPGDRTAPPRQRTLRATIDWSHDLLSGPEQVLLRRLSVFAGWSLEMAEQVCADRLLPTEEIIGLAAGLVDKSLVVVEPEVLGQARYRLLDSIRAYAAQRLADAGEAAAVQLRLRDYALIVCEHAEAVGMAVIPAGWPAAVDVFRRYDVDSGNVRQVLGGCQATGDVQSGLRLCTAVRPCWIVRGHFAEGEEWFARFLALDHTGLPPAVLGAALVGRAQLVMPNQPAAAQDWARQGLALCRSAGQLIWTATAYNVLAEAALHAGQLDEAERCAADALATARTAGNGWNEGYALGTQATLAAAHGKLREAGRLGEAALAVMRGIDQQWGVARTLLGLGTLARLRRDPAGAIECYREALPILREIDSRPDIARALAGIGRVALDQGDLDVARQHLTESLRLSWLTGARTGVARGLEAVATLTARDGDPGLAVQLTAAAATLRAAAGLPALSAERTQQQLDPARSLGPELLGQHWQRGLGLTADGAVALVLRPRPAGPAGPAGPVNGAPAAAAPPSSLPSLPPQSSLTPREREITALIAQGYSNRAIAGELVISPATAARHVANILAKLGFTSRAQIAAWAAGNGSLPSMPAARQRGSLIP